MVKRAAAKKNLFIRSKDTAQEADDSLKKGAREVLEKRFGFSELRAGQREVIDALLEGRSALAIFPTGGGKSLCYQLPSLVLEGLTLVVSPLLALMKDQVDGLVAKGIPAARLDSTLTAEEYAVTMNQLRTGQVKLLYLSPEKLANTEFQKTLKELSLAMIAVDEAHCISEWGHNFRPDYLKLAATCKRLKAPRILALTATATPAVERDVRKAFRIAKGDVVKRSFHRENLDLRITTCTVDERKPLLLERMMTLTKPMIIYVTRQETAEEVATFLTKSGHPAKAYHAGLRTDLRKEIQDGFMQGGVEIVVATIAFGMGVDKSNIRSVIHYNLPKSLEGYTQEIGRAGRDGEPAVCEMLACANDLTVLENFIFSDIPSEQALRNFLERVLRRGDQFDIWKYEISTTCDMRQTVVETIFTYLEMEGVLKAGVKFFETYRLKLLQPLKRALAGREADEKAQLKTIFKPLDAEWKWLTVQTREVAEQLGLDRLGVRTLLDEMEAAGDIVVKKSGWRQSYTRLMDIDEKALCNEMVLRFQEREVRELGRLAQVVKFSCGKACLTKKLLAHFGEKMAADCSHCDRCAGKSPRALKRGKARKITGEEMEEIGDLHQEKLAPLGTARQLTRFLCGMSSPASMRARLYRHDAYGLLADLPFEEVEIVAESFF